jgi:transposase-like protein
MKNRRKFSASFKAKVAIDAIKGQKTLSELCSDYELEAVQISKWKKQFLEKSSLVFTLEEPERSTEKEFQKLYEKIGRLEVERDFLKKNLKMI